MKPDNKDGADRPVQLDASGTLARARGVGGLLIGLCAAAVAWGGEADLLDGLFWSPEHDAKVKFYKAGDRVCARFAWLQGPSKDVNNPDARLRARELLAVEFLHDFVAAGPDKWVEGTVYDPDTGRTYHGTIWFKDGDHRRLYLRGFVGLSLFGRTETFQRVKLGE